jgi:hypothetical protein
MEATGTAAATGFAADDDDVPLGAGAVPTVPPLYGGVLSVP